MRTLKLDQKIWNIADRNARDALGAIANHQITTWVKFPTTNTAQDFVREAILKAIEEATAENSGSGDANAE